jgi:hypothetical protein
MSNESKSMSPISKITFTISLLILFLWVAPTAVSFYKNKKLYQEKLTQLENLDNREIASDAKAFHAEVFKIDAETYFDSVEVISIPNNKYKIDITFKKDSIDKFHAFLKDLSLNYRVSLDDKLVYKDVNKSLKVSMVVEPF